MGDDAEPLGPLLRIRQLRQYLRARQQVDTATDDAPATPAAAALVGDVKMRRFALEGRLSPAAAPPPPVAPVTAPPTSV